jgi:hypothetical protein
LTALALAFLARHELPASRDAPAAMAADFSRSPTLASHFEIEV